MASGPGLPSAEFLRALEVRAARCGSPTQRLKFLRQEIAAYAPPPVRPTWRRRWPWVSSALLLAAGAASMGLYRRPAAQPVLAMPVPRMAEPQLVTAKPVPDVWLVETRSGAEVYSNGLRIESDPGMATRPRQYRALIRGSLRPAGPRATPAGIVFHTTEGHLAPFEPRLSGILQRDGEATLAFVRRNRLYHFVLDRFGTVRRGVAESDVANHAGVSIWADDRNVYLNLNQSFLGVAFEAGSGPAGDGYRASPAQVSAARTLTEMLRSKYGIPEGNCVTHAQVSVNPENMLIGYHTDWGRNFPFAELSLHNGYDTPVAAVALFGFGFDANFLRSVDGWNGLLLAEGQVARDAAAARTTSPAYRRQLQRLYWQAAEALRTAAAEAESANGAPGPECR